MTRKEKGNARLWVEAWKRAGPELERERRKRIRKASTKRSIEILSGTLRMNLRRRPKTLHSGLVEMQAIFSKARK
jgi:hypothetical protein